MSLNTKLSKPFQFIFECFEKAAREACMDEQYRQTNLILAGGAVRDLYFNRSTRDLDLYFNSCNIDPNEFARALSRIDVDEQARALGFTSAVLVRPSDLSSGSKQVSADPNHIPVPNIWHTFGVVAAKSSSSSLGSGSGNKQDESGRVHPLQSVEEFLFYVDNERYIVELMTVAMDPVEYAMRQFAVKLSRCYYDGQRVHYSTDFFTDARNKTLTVACPIAHARFDRLFSYYLPKMKTYFPDFDVRIDLDQMNSRRK